jgi:hypothetical protein
MGLGDDVLMLDRNGRHVESDHAPCLAREIAARGDHVLAYDLALVGDDLPFAAGQALDRRNRRVAVDLRTPLARTAGQRLREVGGLDIAILRMLNRAEQTVDVAKRPHLLDFGGRQKLDLDPANRGRNSRIIFVLVEPVLRAREADVGNLPEADV